MATIVNTPAAQSDEGNTMGMAIALILFAVVLLLLFVYGLPLMRSTVIPEINVPGKIDVNLNQPGK